MDIVVENKTSKTKTILIFGRKHKVPLKPLSVDEAFQVLNIGSRGKASFTYSDNISVGAYYRREDGEEISMGPYPAESGSTWTVIFTSQNDSGSMIKDTNHPNEYSGIVIYNKPPPNTPWGGRMVDVALYNSGSKLLIKKGLRVGDYAELKATSKLYFCCMEAPSPSGAISFDFSDVFADDEAARRSSISEEDTDSIEFSRLTKIDLRNYPNGVDVELKENEINGMLSFTPKPKF